MYYKLYQNVLFTLLKRTNQWTKSQNIDNKYDLSPVDMR
jgi:hypothetical protein